MTGRLAELADLGAEHFTYAIMRDALIAPDPHLADELTQEFTYTFGGVPTEEASSRGQLLM